eukprot:CAMPEP_0198276400 /NCGR_PEP_ID=MMETSP1447-20131203/65291_1 /TAXON_ID=420782 /ORGANISM="Chaetoceros dichaeta, Strain CCMP1751" /LENGTH=235 /DNA_ID=CAMNT_0043971347 /DNA_START=79 /DNA_END=786 /DNA_ORIENTATION=+
MKLSSTIPVLTGSVISLLSARKVEAFGVNPSAATSCHYTHKCVPGSRQLYSSDSDEDKGGNAFGSEFASTGIYGRMGIKEEEIAIGIDANEVFQWLGTREDITGRFMRDNKKMEPEQAEAEIKRFMMDAEMVNAFIAYEKKKADPNFIRDSVEAEFSDPATLSTYATWILGGIGFAYVKNRIIEPKFASGEWDEIRLKLPQFDFGKAAVDSVAQVVDSAVTDTTLQIAHSASHAM